jgi:hypothetical protein
VGGRSADPKGHCGAIEFPKSSRGSPSSQAFPSVPLEAAVAENGAGTVPLREVVVALPEEGVEALVGVVRPVEGDVELTVVAAGRA